MFSVHKSTAYYYTRGGGAGVFNILLEHFSLVLSCNKQLRKKGFLFIFK